MKSVIKISIICLMLTTIVACASSIAKVEQMQKLRVINIHDSVKIPEGGSHHETNVATVPINFGTKTFAGLDARLIQNNVSLNEMVFREFSSRLANSGRLKMGYPADATLYLEVQTYGFHKPISFSVNDLVTRKFGINIRGTLVDTNRQIIWQDVAYITSLSDRLNTYKLNDIIDRPEVAKQAMQESISIVAYELINNLLTIIIHGS